MWGSHSLICCRILENYRQSKVMNYYGIPGLRHSKSVNNSGYTLFPSKTWQEYIHQCTLLHITFYWDFRVPSHVETAKSLNSRFVSVTDTCSNYPNIPWHMYSLGTQQFIKLVYKQAQADTRITHPIEQLPLMLAFSNHLVYSTILLSHTLFVPYEFHFNFHIKIQV